MVVVSLFERCRDVWMRWELALLALALVSACAAPIPPLGGTAIAGEGDVVTVSGVRDVTVDVVSAQGIGEAAIMLSAPPQSVTIRLHLDGLESFRFQFGETVIGASVASQGENDVRVYQMHGAEETALAPGDPLWLEIDYIGGDSTEMHTDNGYYEITPPPAFFASGAMQFTIAWIDFYR